MSCTCAHIMVGFHRTQNKNWNPECEEHEIKSQWYNSDEEKIRREEERQYTMGLQKIARSRRLNEIDQEEGIRQIKELEKIRFGE